MFGLYLKKENIDSINFTFQKEIKLAGCNEGLIPRILRSSIPQAHDNVTLWDIDFPKIISELEQKQATIIIDIMPKKMGEILLCELIKAWGYSYNNWTPILLRLRALVDDSLKEFRKEDFNIDRKKKVAGVFTITSLRGGIENGELTGTWTFPGPGATNSALLWPVVTKHFCGIMEQFEQEQG